MICRYLIGSLAQTVDRHLPGGHARRVNEPVWFVAGRYWWIVSITYLIVPLAVRWRILIALNWRGGGKGINGMVLGAGMFVITWLMGRYILDLFIWWRQVLKAKARIAEGSALGAR